MPVEARRPIPETRIRYRRFGDHAEILLEWRAGDLALQKGCGCESFLFLLGARFRGEVRDTSLIPQSDERINLRCAPGGNPNREHCGGAQHERYR